MEKEEEYQEGFADEEEYSEGSTACNKVKLENKVNSENMAE